MYDLARFELSDMIRCGSALRSLSRGEDSMEEVAGKVVRHLYDGLVDKQAGERACALVRFYKTHPYEALGTELREFASHNVRQAVDACDAVTDLQHGSSVVDVGTSIKPKQLLLKDRRYLVGAYIKCGGHTGPLVLYRSGEIIMVESSVRECALAVLPRLRRRSRRLS